MEGAVEDEDGLTARRGARDLHRVLDRFGPRVQEDRLLFAATAGRELREPAADVDVRLVHPDHEALMQIAVGLLVDRRDDGGRSVTRVLAAETAGEVDVLAAVDVPDARALGAIDDERRRRDSAGDIAVACVLNGLARRPLRDLHRSSLTGARDRP